MSESLPVNNHEITSGDEEKAKKYRSLVKKVVTASVVTFGLSAINNYAIQKTPVGFSQTAMEGVDSVIPISLEIANQEDRKKHIKKGIKWRSITNLAHIAAGTAGIYEATNFWNQEMDYDPKGILISAGIGAWNLGIWKSIKNYKTEKETGVHTIVEISPEDVAIPESPEDVFRESHHSHPDVSTRNIENLEMCTKSNIVEAAPPLIGPFLQMAWENGSAGMVMAANAAVVAMAGAQQLKDVNILRSLSQS